MAWPQPPLAQRLANIPRFVFGPHGQLLAQTQAYDPRMMIRQPAQVPAPMPTYSKRAILKNEPSNKYKRFERLEKQIIEFIKTGHIVGELEWPPDELTKPNGVAKVTRDAPTPGPAVREIYRYIVERFRRHYEIARIGSKPNTYLPSKPDFAHFFAAYFRVLKKNNAQNERTRISNLELQYHQAKNNATKEVIRVNRSHKVVFYNRKADRITTSHINTTLSVTPDTILNALDAVKSPKSFEDHVVDEFEKEFSQAVSKDIETPEVFLHRLFRAVKSANTVRFDAMLRDALSVFEMQYKGQYVATVGHYFKDDVQNPKTFSSKDCEVLCRAKDYAEDVMFYHNKRKNITRVQGLQLAITPKEIEATTCGTRCPGRRNGRTSG